MNKTKNAPVNRDRELGQALAMICDANRVLNDLRIATEADYSADPGNKTLATRALAVSRACARVAQGMIAMPPEAMVAMLRAETDADAVPDREQSAAA